METLTLSLFFSLFLVAVNIDSNNTIHCQADELKDKDTVPLWRQPAFVTNCLLSFFFSFNMASQKSHDFSFFFSFFLCFFLLHFIVFFLQRLHQKTIDITFRSLFLLSFLSFLSFISFFLFLNTVCTDTQMYAQNYTLVPYIIKRLRKMCIFYLTILYDFFLFLKISNDHSIHKVNFAWEVGNSKQYLHFFKDINCTVILYPTKLSVRPLPNAAPITFFLPDSQCVFTSCSVFLSQSVTG